MREYTRGSFKEYSFEELNLSPENIQEEEVYFKWARLQCINVIIRHHKFKALVDSQESIFVNMEDKIFMYWDCGWAHYATKTVVIRNFENEELYGGCGCEYVTDVLKKESIWN